MNSKQVQKMVVKQVALVCLMLCSLGSVAWSAGPPSHAKPKQIDVERLVPEWSFGREEMIDVSTMTSHRGWKHKAKSKWDNKNLVTLEEEVKTWFVEKQKLTAVGPTFVYLVSFGQKRSFKYDYKFLHPDDQKYVQEMVKKFSVAYEKKSAVKHEKK